MASEETIRQRLLEILETADLNVATERIIRKQLEQELGCSLADRKEFIRGEVGNFLRRRQEEAEGGAAEDEEEEEEEEEAEEEQKVKKTRKSSKRALKEEKAGQKRRTGGGLTKVCRLSDSLGELIGFTELPRTQVVKEIWVYIRKHDLQDPKNRKMILCDAPMQQVLGTASVGMFQMNKYLSKHIFPIEGEEPKPKKQKAEGGAASGPGTGFTAPQPISEKLRAFMRTSETELKRHEVVSFMWTYIKENNLQNPKNKRQILCDAELQKLFGVTTFNGFGITKYLAPHIGKEVREKAVGGPKAKKEEGEEGQEFEEGVGESEQGGGAFPGRRVKAENGDDEAENGEDEAENEEEEVDDGEAEEEDGDDEEEEEYAEEDED
eukprot:TRINITY_DN2069_c1_g1_i1.p1 TRINITY_DN2069_c1_g1~~TRINITY_DN2069_c1_g1_i1.p1  ORF type:complete len:380 (-),score=139.47 TRINITY_DN2069_c1_g1_i1:322-1461(-)